MKLNIFKKSLLEAQVIKNENYKYLVHPLTDGIPEIKPELLEEVVNELFQHIKKLRNIDKIVTIEAMGIPITTMLSKKINKPFVIIRKRLYGLNKEKNIEQITGYSKSKLSINGLRKDDNIIIVDDIISTGGTLRAVLKSFKEIGVIVKGIFILIDKGSMTGQIEKEFNVNINIIVKIKIEKDKVEIINI